MTSLADFLTISRGVLAPVLLYSAFVLDRHLGTAFLVAYLVGFLTDVLDGWVARKMCTVNPQSAALDSFCDLLFQGSAVVCAVAFRPDVLASYSVGIVLAIVAQLFNWSVGLAKYKRLVGYHTTLTKIWAVMLFASIVELCVSQTSMLMIPTIELAIISNLEEAAITLWSKRYCTDVRNLAHALAAGVLGPGVRVIAPLSADNQRVLSCVEHA
jgi:CDP-diacylglycerol--glycerol-3-phosphate 3-phosphatidyltransferase